MTLWTHTPMFRLSPGLLYCQTLALLLCRPLFYGIELYTDDRGLALAKLMRWDFTDIRTDLQDFRPEGLLHVWALGKLKTISLQREPFIHLDWDVFLHRALPLRMHTARLLAQSPDKEHYYESPEMRQAMKLAEVPRHGDAYNVGIVGGHPQLMAEYASGAIALAARFADSGINGTTTSMLLEQYGLASYAERHGLLVECLLPRHPTNADAKRAGYTHLIGDTKHDPKWLGRVKTRLQCQFPQQYEHVANAIKALAL